MGHWYQNTGGKSWDIDFENMTVPIPGILRVSEICVTLLLRCANGGPQDEPVPHLRQDHDLDGQALHGRIDTRKQGFSDEIVVRNKIFVRPPHQRPRPWPWPSRWPWLRTWCRWWNPQTLNKLNFIHFPCLQLSQHVKRNATEYLLQPAAPLCTLYTFSRVPPPHRATSAQVDHLSVYCFHHWSSNCTSFNA